MTTHAPDTPCDHLNPNWSNLQRRDWKIFITDEVAGLWDSFTQVQKAALARQAQSMVDEQDWEDRS